jgi:hypothetical protein
MTGISETARRCAARRRLLAAVAMLALSVPASSLAQPAASPAQPVVAPAAASTGSAPENLAEVGAKLSNPVSDVWALFTEFDLFFSDGNVNHGSSKVGGRMLFQPILPFPLYGRGDRAWKLITRPTVPILFSQPIPTGPDQFKDRGGLGDIQLPMLVSPPTGDWLLGAGPAWLFPTSTNDAFGRQQWGVGPTAVVGYKTEKWIAGAFPQYYFGIADRSDRHDGVPPDASYLNLLYFAFYNLPDAWQIGTNPTISYDHRATRGNKWNVPIGLTITKTTRVGRVPVKFQFAIQYSVVSQDDFGQRAQITLNVIPVIPSLVKEPIFGE